MPLLHGLLYKLYGHFINMSIYSKLDLVEKLRDLSGRLHCLNKEISTIPVSGVSLTREDLGIRRNNKKTVHGQKHEQPINTNRITPPSGTGSGEAPSLPGSFYSGL